MAWLNRGARKNLGVGLIGLFVWGGLAWGQAPLLTLQPSNLEGKREGGSKNQESIRITCYDLFNAEPINCLVTATLKPLDPRTTTPAFFGGHLHTPDAQLLGTVENANDPSAGAGKSTKGNTLSGFTLVYTAPDASGEVQLETKWEPPFNYQCQNENEGDLGNFTNPCVGIDHFNIALLGLEELPPNSAYTVLRDLTDTHPQGTFGTPRTLKSLAVLAVIYGIATNQTRTLSINDMSLPQGGLFDFLATWKFPHDEHRVGTQADINQQGIPCTSDFALQAAIRAVGATRLCESEGRKHIDF